MAQNKFFTIMIVPEKTQQVVRFVIPNAVFKGGILAAAFLGVLATVMVLDYSNVMNQISENKQLRGENRQLKEQVQVFKDKMLTIENTLDRVRTFATKLRVITNVEDRGGSSAPSGSGPALPAPFVPGPAEQYPVPTSTPGDPNFLGTPAPEGDTIHEGISNDVDTSQNAPARPNESYGQKTSHGPRLKSLFSTTTESASFAESVADTEVSVFVQVEFDKLNQAHEILNDRASAQEREIQEIYEWLSDKKSMLLSMPTQIPTDGYITSGFGIRYSPYGGKKKMHEGIDIANRYGADIYSPGDGLVLFAGIKPGYGKILAIDHGYGLKTYYGHTSLFYVGKGQRIKRGQRIAAVGNTGRSTGPHLHYEIHANNTPIDPMYYILDR